VSASMSRCATDTNDTLLQLLLQQLPTDVSLQVTTRCGTTGDTRETPLGNFDSHTTQFLECATETAEYVLASSLDRQLLRSPQPALTHNHAP